VPPVVPKYVVFDAIVVLAVDFPMVIEVAFVVPTLRAAAVAVSTRGVRREVSALPVPDIQKLVLACWAAFWFTMYPLVPEQLPRSVQILALPVRVGIVRV
jgi:hypothetical protein